MEVINAIGRRKSAVARVYVKEGNGKITINKRDLANYFPSSILQYVLDRICTHILAFEGNSEVFFFQGSYSEYEENKLKRLGNEEPKRVRYRKLMED